MSANSLLIGQLIYDVITDNESTVKNDITKVYPLVADNDTLKPFVVYSKSNVYCDTYTKDGYVSDKVSFMITVVSSTYDKSCDIANKIRKMFEGRKISNNDLKIYNIKLTSNTESYADKDTFTQVMYFECNAE